MTFRRQTTRYLFFAGTIQHTVMKFRQDFNSLFSENQTDLITGIGFRRMFSKIAQSSVKTIRTVWSNIILYSIAFCSVDGIYSKFIYKNTSFDRSLLQITSEYISGFCPHTNYYYSYRYRYHYRYCICPLSMIINVNWTCQYTRTVLGFVIHIPFNLHANWSLIYYKTNCSRAHTDKPSN